MAITISVTNPSEHTPGELNALSELFAKLAGTPVKDAVAVHTPISGEIPAAPFVAPSASDGSSEPTPSDADANGEQPTGDFDSSGVKWDARIHSETRSTNKDGSWRQKRGVDPELVAQVLAEQKSPFPQAPAAPEPAPIPHAPAAPEPAPIPHAPSAPEPAPIPHAPAAPAGVSPADVVRFVTLNKISPEQAIPVYKSFGLANAAALFTQPELAGPILEALKALVV